MKFEFLCFLNLIRINLACECEAEPWTSWTGSCPDCGEHSLARTRVCSTYNGWALGLVCHDKDKTTVSETMRCNIPLCRKI